MSKKRKIKPREEKRSFESAQGGRLNSDWLAPAYSTQDTELKADLRTLRARSRQMVRDNPHALNLKRMIQNNVVGTGIGMQCQIVDAKGNPDQDVNDRIEAAWYKWCEADSCHTAGRLCMNDMLRLLIGAVFQDGEILIRKVHARFGESRVPFSLEVVEADLLADDKYSISPGNGNTVRLGVEVNKWMRPRAYWILPEHPGDVGLASGLRNTELRRIPAGDIIHLYLVERWPQTRGTPWMHSVLKKIKDMGGYVNSEIVAARAAANIVGFVQPSLDTVEAGADPGKLPRFVKSEPGMFQRLLPGETFSGFAPSRPNAQLNDFMRYMLREVASGVGVSYETLSRDYSQSNYSSSRLALLDDRDQWRVLQGWLIDHFLKPVYFEWLDHAVLSGEVILPDYFQNKEKYRAVRFKPRGWSWVDPAKEVNAFIAARDAGFMSDSDVVATMGNGQDYEDVCKQRSKDRDIAAYYGEPERKVSQNGKLSEPEKEESEEDEQRDASKQKRPGGSGDSESSD